MTNINDIIEVLKQNIIYKEGKFTANNTYEDQDAGVDFKFHIDGFEFRLFEGNVVPSYTDFTHSPAYLRKAANAFEKLYKLVNFTPKKTEIITLNGKKYRRIS